jgi:hypothetical protein
MAKNKLATVRPDEEWQVESDMRCLMEARTIRNDKKRMGKVKALAQKKLAEVASLASNDDNDADD